MEFLLFKKNRTVDINCSRITERDHFIISQRPNNYRPEGQDSLCVGADCYQSNNKEMTMYGKQWNFTRILVSNISEF
jgi:hypothetical protein